MANSPESIDPLYVRALKAMDNTRMLRRLCKEIRFECARWRLEHRGRSPFTTMLMTTQQGQDWSDSMTQDRRLERQHALPGALTTKSGSTVANNPEASRQPPAESHR